MSQNSLCVIARFINNTKKNCQHENKNSRLDIEQKGLERLSRCYCGHHVFYLLGRGSKCNQSLLEVLLFSLHYYKELNWAYTSRFLNERTNRLSASPLIQESFTLFEECSQSTRPSSISIARFTSGMGTSNIGQRGISFSLFYH